MIWLLLSLALAQDCELESAEQIEVKNREIIAGDVTWPIGGGAKNERIETQLTVCGAEQSAVWFKRWRRSVRARNTLLGLIVLPPMWVAAPYAALNVGTNRARFEDSLGQGVK